LLVATPGAGKTAFALRIAAELLSDRSVDAITVVVPTEHLKTQWALAAAAEGIALDPKFRNSAAHTSAEYHGIVVTYTQVASHPARHRASLRHNAIMCWASRIGRPTNWRPHSAAGPSRPKPTTDSCRWAPTPNSTR
jgi:superfamily II DNA or RNA helicase